MSRFRFSFALGLLIAGLGGCTQVQMQPDTSPSGQQSTQEMPIGSWNGRFSLKVERTPSSDVAPSLQDSAQGVFVLQSRAGGELSLELSSPVGQTIATVEVKSGLAILALSDGKTYRAQTAQSLLEDQLGWRLPIERLPNALSVLQTNQDNALKAKSMALSLGADWSALLTPLENGRNRLQLTWEGLSRNVSKLALTMIIEDQVGVSTNLRR